MIGMFLSIRMTQWYVKQERRRVQQGETPNKIQVLKYSEKALKYRIRVGLFVRKKNLPHCIRYYSHFLDRPDTYVFICVHIVDFLVGFNICEGDYKLCRHVIFFYYCAREWF